MDVDIDSGNRENILKLIRSTPAMMSRNGVVGKHASGVYVTKIPRDPETGLCTLDYQVAEDLGYIKLDLLNLTLYERVTGPEHLDKLVSTEPDWSMLTRQADVDQLIHINGHFSTLQKMPEPVDSIPRMAMFLSVMRPAKRRLIGLPWKTVGETVWIKPTDGSYAFRRSHAVSYALLVAVNMNLNMGVK